MGWVDKTSFNPIVKSWSYDKFIKVFGESNGAEAAKKFGVKKTKKKKDTDSEGGK